VSSQLSSVAQFFRKVLPRSPFSDLLVRKRKKAGKAGRVPLLF